MTSHFIIAGAQRSATTYLSRILSAHPEIIMAEPTRPEPKFFLKPEMYKTGIETYYRNFFRDYDSQCSMVYGEKSTSYIESKPAALKIKELLPSAKIIFVLRNPIERAMSNIAFSRMHGFESAPIDVAIMREIDHPETVLNADGAATSVSPQAYLARGCYADYLSSYFEIFGSENIHIQMTEQMIGSLKEIQSVYEFLGINTNFVPAMLNEKVNMSQKTKNDVLALKTRAKLDAYFAPKIRKLEELTGLDFSSWC